ncbi:hypothetical protein B0T10DRAFT_550304 [Thelonectria olida]|uniref:Peptidase A1 domain-containing protein n=1 Tax=Thelonectria olida TaxID=1576542 RepID=A0A9P8W2S7_9HYPO|nr:hypothetical protein B0T10DRAFT_550304 [Thelonectria olida]
MLSSLLTSLFVAGILLPGIEANNCSVEPLVLPLRNVTFPNGIGANRGIKLLLGDQTEGLRISTILNNTRVRNILDCPSDNVTDLIACQGASGSIYSTTDGSFKAVSDESDWDVEVIDPQPNDGSTTVVHGYDIANFSDVGAVIDDYPVEVWANQESVNLSALALGPASSTLERVVKHNLAPSCSWSLDYGSTSELHPRDGELIIGGVNEARFSKSKKMEFDMWGAGTSVNCPLQVLVADVILTNEDGDHSLFPDADSKISACIDTIQNSFTLTESMFEKFQKIGKHVDSDGLDFGPSVFPLDSESLLGSLKIRLSNGYESVIPHYELVNHQRGTDSQGKYAVLNSSRIAATVSYGQSDLGNDVPILGGVFLSQNYLQVDYETKKFWLSPQVANGTGTDKITATCTKDNSSSTSDASDSNPDDSDSSSSNLGVKIGVPVGVAAVAALGILGFFLWWRRRRAQKAIRMSDMSIPPTAATPVAASVIPHENFPKSPQSGFTQMSNHPTELGDYPKSPSPVTSPVPLHHQPTELDARVYAVELDSRAV